MMERGAAFELLKVHIKNEKMLYHSLASEAVMRGLARKLGRDEQLWALAGLLHDIDAELTDADPQLHGLKSEEILAPYKIPDEVLQVIRMHNEEAAGKPRSTEFEHALAAGETLTGLIYATALVYPDQKIAEVKPKSIIKRMKQKAFAASVNRENIMECEKIGIPLQEFVEICLDAMKKIGSQIGL